MTSTEATQKNEERRSSKTPFEIVVQEDVKPPVIALKGDVDVAVADKLSEQLNRLVEAGCTQLTIDLSAVTYVDSTGLSQLVEAARLMGSKRTVSLVGCNPRLIKLLSVTGLSNMFELVLPNAA